MRKSLVTKSQQFQELINQAERNQVDFVHILADNWFGSKANMQFIQKMKKFFVFGLKSNRTVALSETDKKKGHFVQLKTLDLKEDQSKKIWIKGLDFPVLLLGKIFKNENGSTGTLHLVTNDFSLENDKMYTIYQKRWKVEEYHKSIKQNSCLSKSPTRTVRSQSNHIFSSIISFCKLEFLKFKTAMNHFAIRYKLLIKANQAAWKELQKMKIQTSSA